MPSAAWGSLASAPFLEALRDGDYPFLLSDSAAQEAFLLSALSSSVAMAFCDCLLCRAGHGARPGIGVLGLFKQTNLEPQNWA